MDEMTLFRKIEEGFMFFGYRLYRDGVIWPVNVPGVTAQVSPLQTGLLNLTGLATFTEENVDKGIQQVIAGYRQEKKVFSWLVGPTSQPKDIADHLTSAGLTHQGSISGMVLRDVHQPLKSNPDIDVKQVSIAELERHIDMQASAYGLPVEIASICNRYLEALGTQASIYFAYVPEREEPVAWSVSVFRGDGLVVLLGAATLEEYRGRGIYASMVAKRLEDAQTRDVTAAIIQADPKTSAPICAKLGFEHVCSLDLYAFAE